MENKTHLMLCFPAQWDPTPEESQTIKGAVSQFLSTNVYLCLHLKGKETYFSMHSHEINIGQKSYLKL